MTSDDQAHDEAQALTSCARQALAAAACGPEAILSVEVRLLEKCGFRRAESVWHGENEHILLVLEEAG